MQRKWLKTEGRIRKYDPAWVPDKSSRERLDALLKIWQVTAYSITNAPIRGHPGGGGGTPGSHRVFARRRLQILPNQNQGCLTKSY